MASYRALGRELVLHMANTASILASQLASLILNSKAWSKY